MTPFTGNLDEFRVLRRLGSGGMGTVYLGHDTVLDRAVAIKLIGSGNPDEASRERFLVEARAVARLSHPNVVMIYRVGTTADGRPYLVQELIRGTSLDGLPRPQPSRRVIELAVGIARGLAAAHRRGILHRDIKPSNVMIDEAGVARLLDFGLAKLSSTEPMEPVAGDVARRERAIAQADLEVAATADPAAHANTDLVETAPGPVAAKRGPGARFAADRTAPGSLVGTPRYVAPEIWRGTVASVRSDLYSLGALLYELLAGVPAYGEMELAALRRSVAERDPRPLLEHAPTADPGLVRAIERCMQREPADRPASADEVMHDLERLLAGAPDLPDGNPYRGLRAFDAAHRGLFFGRGTDVSTLVDRLRGERLVVLTGDSGIGKSSVCHAGIVPAIVAGALADGRHWRAITLVPGRAPFTALCEALAIPADRRALDGAELARAMRPGDDAGVLLVIDQLEELVTVADPTEAARTAETVAAIGEAGPACKALLSVRGDFLSRIATAQPALAPALGRGLHFLRVLAPADLREAVVGPARATGVRFEHAAIVDELVAAVADNPGALPLLQFALAELWSLRDVDRGVIPATALAAIGGVAGGLARHADRVLAALSDAARAAARRVLVRLVTADGTRAVRERVELAPDGDPAAATALEALVAGRLVVAREAASGATYELAHEALIARWTTLREWLDADVGRRVIRDRLAAAAGEWAGGDRRSDLLWSRRQLADADGLDELAPLETEFVAAARRVHRRRRAMRAVLIAAVPLAAVAIWTGLRIAADRERDREVATRLANAASRERAGDEAAGVADRHRADAIERFDRGDTDGGERAWEATRTQTRAARVAFAEAAAELELALRVDAERDDVRRRLADVFFRQALVAEAAFDTDGATDLIRRIGAHDRALVDRWRAPARVELELGRPGEMSVRPYVDTAGHLALGPAVANLRGERVEVELAPGSYLVEITTADGVHVQYPMSVTRGEHLAAALAIPAAIPDGFVYVGPGRFLTGNANDEFLRRYFLQAPPLHAVETTGYLIARTEVTFADWIAYLDELPGDAREQRRPATRGGSTMVRLDGGGGAPFALTLQPATVAYHAVAGVPLRYASRDRRQSVRWERLPVSGVSFDDAIAYASWLAATGRVPRARLCTQPEWERAARGADGRNYPGGEILDVDDANIDVTYGRDPGGFGPDEVGAHPRSDSPFGVADMAGNVWEWVRGRADAPMTRGGSWYHGAASAIVANRDFGDASLRDIRLGIRICADPAR